MDKLPYTIVLTSLSILKIMYFLLLKLEKVACKIMSIIYQHSFLLCYQPERIVDSTREKQREEGREALEKEGKQGRMEGKRKKMKKV